MLFCQNCVIQAKLSNLATCLTKENGQIKQVVRINRLTYLEEKVNRLGPGCSNLSTSLLNVLL